MHKCCLVGPFLVQLQEVWDISLSDEQRRDRSKLSAEELDNQVRNRMLKLAMSDGVQEVVGFEYQRIHAISAETAPGTKLVVHNATVRHGMLRLTDLSRKIGGLVSMPPRDSPQLRPYPARFPTG